MILHAPSTVTNGESLLLSHRCNLAEYLSYGSTANLAIISLSPSDLSCQRPTSIAGIKSRTFSGFAHSGHVRSNFSRRLKIVMLRTVSFDNCSAYSRCIPLDSKESMNLSRSISGKEINSFTFGTSAILVA